MVDEGIVRERQAGDREPLGAGRIGERLQHARNVVHVGEAVANEEDADSFPAHLRPPRLRPIHLYAPGCGTARTVSGHASGDNRRGTRRFVAGRLDGTDGGDWLVRQPTARARLSGARTPC